MKHDDTLTLVLNRLLAMPDKVTSVKVTPDEFGYEWRVMPTGGHEFIFRCTTALIMDAIDPVDTIVKGILEGVEKYK